MPNEEHWYNIPPQMSPILEISPEVPSCMKPKLNIQSPQCKNSHIYKCKLIDGCLM